MGPAGIALGGKKKLSFSAEEDFAIKVFENDGLVATYEVRGLQELLEGKWKDYNRTGPPKISATMPLEFSGIVELKVPTVTIEEVYWVNVTKPKPKPNVTNGTANATADGAEKKEEDKKEEDKKEDTKEEEKKEDAAGDNATNAS